MSLCRQDIIKWPNDRYLDTRALREVSVLGLVECKDGWSEVLPAQQHMWESLVAAVGDPPWANELGGTADDRLVHNEELNQLFAPWLHERTRAEIFDALREFDVPGGPVRLMGDLLTCEQLRSREFLQTVAWPMARPPRSPPSPTSCARRAAPPGGPAPRAAPSRPRRPRRAPTTRTRCATCPPRPRPARRLPLERRPTRAPDRLAARHARARSHVVPGGALREHDPRLVRGRDPEDREPPPHRPLPQVAPSPVRLARRPQDRRLIDMGYRFNEDNMGKAQRCHGHLPGARARLPAATRRRRRRGDRGLPARHDRAPRPRLRPPDRGQPAARHGLALGQRRDAAGRAHERLRRRLRGDLRTVRPQRLRPQRPRRVPRPARPARRDRRRDGDAGSACARATAAAARSSSTSPPRRRAPRWSATSCWSGSCAAASPSRSATATRSTPAQRLPVPADRGRTGLARARRRDGRAVGATRRTPRRLAARLALGRPRPQGAGACDRRRDRRLDA